jgi:tetratricopeptide (TPR) repeat protein
MLAALLAVALAAPEPPAPAPPPPDPAAEQARRLTREALALYGTALFHQRADRLVEAARTLEEAVRLDPEAAPPRLLLVPLYTALGRPDDAARAAAAVLLIDPSQAETWRTLARLLHEMKRTPEAVNVLYRCVAAPELADRPADLIAAHRDLGGLLAAQGAHAKAADAYRKALTLLADHRAALLLKADAADLELEKAELSEGLGAACLTDKRYDDALVALTDARAAFRAGNKPARATRLAPKLAAARAGLNDLAAAHALLDQYLAGRPRDLDAFALKARLLREAGEGGRVPEVLARAARADPEFLPLRVLLGDEYRRLGDRARAEQAYQAVVAQQADVAAYRGLFTLLAGPGGSGDQLFRLVDGTFRRAKPDDGDKAADNPDAQRAREHARAMATALGREPAAAGLLLTTAVEELTRMRRRGGAVGGASFETWRLLAIVAQRAGQLRLAEELFRGALFNAPAWQQSEVVFPLINVLWRQRKRQDIIELCEQRLQRGRDTSPDLLHSELSLALTQTGQIEEGLRHADEAVKLARGPSQLAMRLRRMRAWAWAERFDEAEADGLKLLREFPAAKDTRDVRYELSHLYSLARRFGKAEEQLRLILELDPGDATAHNDLGYHLAEQNRRLDEAEQLVRRALELDRVRKVGAEDDILKGDGDNPAYLDSLGWVLFRRGRLAEAHALLAQAAAAPEAAGDPVVWDHLGDACARLDRPAEAAAAWERAHELYKTEKRSLHDPRGAEVERKLKRLQRPG